MGRERSVSQMNVNWETVEAMAQRLSPREEIQSSLGLTERQFRRAVRTTHRKSPEAYLAQYYAEARYILRQAQFEAARKGNISMLKWLGIQELGQRHKVDILSRPGDNAPPADTIPAGFRILTPGGADVNIDAQGNLLAEPKPHDEVPIVEALLVEEARESNASEPRAERASRPVRTISGHSEET